MNFYPASVNTMENSHNDHTHEFISLTVFSSNEERTENTNSNEITMEKFMAEENPERKFRKMYFAALAVLLNSISIGFSAAYTATALYSMKHDPDGAFIPNKDEEGWIGSLFAIGALVGGVIAGKLAQSAGRRGAMIISTIPSISGRIIIAFAPSIPYLYFGRIMTGLCCGILSVATPTYLVEISTPEIRGKLGSSFQLFAVIGAFLSVCFGSIMHWSSLAGLGCALSIVTLIAMLFVPESPYWLMTKEKALEAKEVIQWLQGGFVDAADQCESIQKDINNQPQGTFSFKEFLSSEAYKPVFLSLFLIFFQRTCGLYIVVFYTVDIFNDAGSSLSGNVATILVSLVSIFSTFLCTMLTDKAGRKLFLLTSGGFMALSWCIFGVFEYFAWANESYIRTNYGWLPVICLLMFRAAYAIGFGPIPSMMVCEMTTVRLRSVTGGAVIGFSWLCVFTVTKTFRGLMSEIHTYGVYWFYMGISIASCLFVFFLLPETKGKTFEEIQGFFTGKLKVEPNTSSSRATATDLESPARSNEMTYVNI